MVASRSTPANKLQGHRFHDQPGEVSFVDTQVRHGGAASLRMENFTANPHGHGRVMQEVRVDPHRCYRISLWVKTQDLQPASAFRVQVLAGESSVGADGALTYRKLGDWHKLTMLFNSLDCRDGPPVRRHVGRHGRARLWLDDWTLEEDRPVERAAVGRARR